MNNQNIVLTKISGTVSDITNLVTDIDHSGKSITLTNTDAIYIGSVFPFNSLYLRFSGTLNNNASVLSAAFWDATQFRDFYKVIDGTDTSGATFAKSGVLNLIATDQYAPACYDSKHLDELGNIDGYYSLYWTRLKVSATLDAVTLLYIGQLFVESDAAIYKLYPDLQATQYKRVFDAQKSDWLDQRLIASDILISDLITMNQIKFGEQFLDWRLLKSPALHKTAELIYKAQGMKYRDDSVNAQKAYAASLEPRKFGISHGNIIKTQSTYESAPTRFYR
jgi:hypothetical protein